MVYQELLATQTPLASWVQAWVPTGARASTVVAMRARSCILKGGGWMDCENSGAVGLSLVDEEGDGDAFFLCDDEDREEGMFVLLWRKENSLYILFLSS